MKPMPPEIAVPDEPSPTRRSLLTATAAIGGLAVAARLGGPAAFAQTISNKRVADMNPKAFVYTELQMIAPFDQVPWQRVNEAIREQPGFQNKTWFAGLGNQSVGGFYAFDSIGNAERFVTGYFPSEAAGFGVAHNTRIFDAVLTRDASLDIGSPHYGLAAQVKPGAFVYTEVQLSVPFEKAPWADRNPVLKQQPGLLMKTWLSGLHTNTLGGIDAFNTIENARKFAVEDFPKAAQAMNAAFYTRIFDADISEPASRAMGSPYYA